jgi:hypothetical protein
MEQSIFQITGIIVKSYNDKYYESKLIQINIKKKIGEGSYGMIYLIDNNNILKIFKNSTVNNTILHESEHLIPNKYENRELMFFLKNNKKNKNQKKYMITIDAIGIIRDNNISNLNNIVNNSYFIIVPYCVPFYNVFKFFNIPLIDTKNGIEFTIQVMKRLTDIAYYLEKNYHLLNLDSKLNNFMFLLYNKYTINNLIMSDFSIIKKMSKKKYNNIHKYYLWPIGRDILIETIPPYAICINGLELLFGNKSLIHLSDKNKLNHYLEIIEKKNKKVYTLFYTGLIEKTNTEKFLKLIMNVI